MPSRCLLATCVYTCGRFALAQVVSRLVVSSGIWSRKFVHSWGCPLLLPRCSSLRMRRASTRVVQFLSEQERKKLNRQMFGVGWFKTDNSIRWYRHSSSISIIVICIVEVNDILVSLSSHIPHLVYYFRALMRMRVCLHHYTWPSLVFSTAPNFCICECLAAGLKRTK
jgi:hypothetical protein